MSEQAQQITPEAAEPSPWPVWKKGGMALAAGLLVLGIGLQGYARVAGPKVGERVATTAEPGSDGAPILASAMRSEGAQPIGSELPILKEGFGDLSGFGGLFPPAGFPVPGSEPRPEIGTPDENERPTQPTGVERPTGQTPPDASIPGDAGQGAAGEPQHGPAVAVSPIFIESGLSFFLGFCIAAALRAIAKIAAIGVGIIALVMIALQYYGVIAIDWSVFQGWFQTAIGWLQTGAGYVQNFVAHALPSGTMGGLGLAAGFKK